MTGRQAYSAIRDILAQAGIEDAAFEAEQLFHHVAGLTHFAANRVSEEDWLALDGLARRRATRYPLQYILGHWGFMGLELSVGPGVLIPRPETESVCLQAAQLAAAFGEAPRVLDLCAGSGALALGVQKLCPQARVTALELDEAAFYYLARNILSCGWEWPRAPAAMLGDVFAYHQSLAEESLDVIVSNPPYVTREEYEELEPEIYHEPRQALVARDEGLAFYRAISRDYRGTLAPGGWLVFEIGAGQGRAVSRILAGEGYEEVTLRRDLAGHHRVAYGKKPAIGN